MAQVNQLLSCVHRQHFAKRRRESMNNETGLAGNYLPRRAETRRLGVKSKTKCQNLYTLHLFICPLQHLSPRDALHCSGKRFEDARLSCTETKAPKRCYAALHVEYEVEGKGSYAQRP